MEKAKNIVTRGKRMKLLSVIVPCYNEEENIALFYETLMENAVFIGNGLDLELLYIDDGSEDHTADEVKKIAKTDSRVHLISFSRNFGKEAALFAGFEKAKGDYVVCMDVDLQDPPELLPEMLGYIKAGYDMVATRRVDRKGEPPVRSFLARGFYKIMSKISKIEIVDGARDYRLMTRKAADAVLDVREYNRFTKGIFGWIGFRVKWIEFENVERRKGETKWSFWKLFMYSLEGITSFSTLPLAFAAFIGIVFCMFSFGLIVFTIIRKIIFGDPTYGWPSLVCIISLVSGVQLFCLGIVGQYLAKTYLEVKRRPVYLKEEEI